MLHVTLSVFFVNMFVCSLLNCFSLIFKNKKGAIAYFQISSRTFSWEQKFNVVGKIVYEHFS
jgi:hypothetical protein